jgi:hypothetical protein
MVVRVALMPQAPATSTDAALWRFCRAAGSISATLRTPQAGSTMLLNRGDFIIASVLCKACSMFGQITIDQLTGSCATRARGQLAVRCELGERINDGIPRADNLLARNDAERGRSFSQRGEQKSSLYPGSRVKYLAERHGGFAVLKL